MRQTTCLFALIPFSWGLCTTPAEASHTHHRPWGYHGPAVTSTEKATHTSLVSDTKDSKILDLVEPSEAATPKTGRTLASQALSYKGTRYEFGGMSKQGLDCSGLVSRIYADLKMHRVPRVSSALYKSGRPVRSAELRPGDLVFFKNTYKHGISHVGVYAGNNKFVHAANKKHGVIVTSMADPYYQLHFAGARRLY